MAHIKNGLVFQIEEFSVNDGPGIRTTVFLKGCPLRCEWCHNPEGQDFCNMIIRNENGCRKCGKCFETAVKDGNFYRFTDKSILACPENLLRYSAKEYTAKELETELSPNFDILNRTGGGVTFSGGEPLSQPEFLIEVLRRLKGKVNLAVQTSGYAPAEIFEQALSLADFFLLDIKLCDEAEHIKYTKASNRLILSNFERLCESKKNFLIRTPLIPQVTDTPDNLEKIARLLSSHNVGYIELLPYNPMAGAKYSLVGQEYKPSFDAQIPVSADTKIFEKYGIEAKIM